MRIQERGLSVDLPAGWEGDFYRREPDAGPLSGAEKTYTVAHMANRSLPPNRGDFGSGVVELMGPDDVLVVLFEYGPESVGTALFSHQGPPWPLKAGRFGPNSLQRPLPGQGGAPTVLHDGQSGLLRVCRPRSAREREGDGPSGQCHAANHDDCGVVRVITPVAGVFATAMLVLALGGGLKVVRPIPTANALNAVGLPNTAWLVRLLGMFEVAVAVSAIVLNEQALYALAAGMYLSFTAFVMLALRRGASLQSCGCFGKVDTPPSGYHIGVNLVLAGSALAMTSSSVSVGEYFRDDPIETAPTLFLAAVAAYVVYVMLTALPEATAQIRRGATS